MTDSRGEVVKMTFEEPVLNRSVADTALIPALDGLKILPFSEFRGF